LDIFCLLEKLNLVFFLKKIFFKKKIIPLHLNKKNKKAGIEPKKAGLNLANRIDIDITMIKLNNLKKRAKFLTGKLANLLNKKININDKNNPSSIK
tara:strand:- start:1343 stop:1630 length:288 start_codon:yes stop_codon:yes gene_type:complete